uniref:Uncharacterized protein n=1 Tax=Glossina morsitans morsitans TaxID=37546 RepID=A0A1B0GEB7_GLOMM
MWQFCFQKIFWEHVFRIESAKIYCNTEN